MREVRSSGEVESFHEWRKRAKDLRHQVEFLSPIWPGVLPALAKDLSRLTDELGAANDLMLLSEEVSSARPLLVEDEPGRSIALSRIAALRDSHWQEALRSGALIYMEKPRAFAGRMDGYLRARQAR